MSQKYLRITKALINLTVLLNNGTSTLRSFLFFPSIIDFVQCIWNRYKYLYFNRGSLDLEPTDTHIVTGNTFALTKFETRYLKLYLLLLLSNHLPWRHPSVLVKFSWSNRIQINWFDHKLGTWWTHTKLCMENNRRGRVNRLRYRYIYAYRYKEFLKWWPRIFLDNVLFQLWPMQQCTTVNDACEWLKSCWVLYSESLIPNVS